MALIPGNSYKAEIGIRPSSSLGSIQLYPSNTYWTGVATAYRDSQNGYYWATMNNTVITPEDIDTDAFAKLHEILGRLEGDIFKITVGTSNTVHIGRLVLVSRITVGTNQNNFSFSFRELNSFNPLVWTAIGDIQRIELISPRGAGLTGLSNQKFRGIFKIDEQTENGITFQPKQSFVSLTASARAETTFSQLTDSSSTIEAKLPPNVTTTVIRGLMSGIDTELLKIDGTLTLNEDDTEVWTVLDANVEHQFKARCTLARYT